MQTPKRPLPMRVLAATLLACFPPGLGAADLLVLGTPHLASLQPAARPGQEQRVVEVLAGFRPTQVCVEAIPGARVAEYARRPQRYGELLAMFAMEALRLAPEQQARRALDAHAAGERAARLAGQATLAPADAAELVSVQLAAFDPWSALLNWSRLDEPGREAARTVLGPAASERLEQMAGKGNEIVRVAIPLAARLGHRQLCAVDPFEDELDVAALAGELEPMLADPAIARGLQRMDAWLHEGWPSESDDGLLQLVQRHNRREFAGRDRAAQWDLFASGPGDHPAGERRLLLWHARNAAIQHELLRAMAGPQGDRTLLIIGAAHRPFLEASMRALPWVRVADAAALLDAAKP